MSSLISMQEDVQSENMYLQAIEELITVATAKNKSRFTEVGFYLGYSVT